MKRLLFFIAIAVCTIALSSCNEKPAGMLYIHYTPEEPDSETQAIINDLKSNPPFPSTAEGMVSSI